MPNKMLIDATHPEETRVVVLRGNRVEEFDFESANRKQLRGNIYLAKVTRVEPSLQAAFVDYGGNRHGFLAFSEIHPDYYQIPVADRQALIAEEERDAARRRRRSRQPRPRRTRPQPSPSVAAPTGNRDVRRSEPLGGERTAGEAVLAAKQRQPSRPELPARWPERSAAIRLSRRPSSRRSTAPDDRRRPSAQARSARGHTKPAE